MIFTLEALDARQGDSLMLHFGTKEKPQLIVIDGGPSGVYLQTLSKRLAALKKSRSPSDSMPIRMVMVSHIDDDHINGILQWFTKLDEQRQNQEQLSCKIATLWHNSFDDILKNAAQELTASFAPGIQAADLSAEMPADLPLSHHSALVLANVPQGRDLRNHATALGLNINQGFKNLVMVPDGQAGKSIAIDPTLSFTVLGPTETRLRDLQTDWDRQIKKLGLAKVADFVDNSVYNLSSIIVLAEAGGKTILLTGDARGDEILEGLKNAGRLQDGKLHLDLLKLPHHGSDRDVSLEFFQALTADHYVCSGNGQYGNPEEATLQMLLDARGLDSFTIHLTYREPRLDTFFQKDQRPGKKYQVLYCNPKDLSLRVDLGDTVTD